jgi:hypothetical protein
MRKLFGLLALVALAAAPATAAWHVIGIPSAVTAKAHVARGTAHVIVAWTDTAATIVRAEIRRRGIQADSTLGGTASDTIWSVRGYTTDGLATFTDPTATFGRTYRYQVRDSIAANAFSSWSDSASVTVPTRKY